MPRHYRPDQDLTLPAFTIAGLLMLAASASASASGAQPVDASGRLRECVRMTQPERAACLERLAVDFEAAPVASETAADKPALEPVPTPAPSPAPVPAAADPSRNPPAATAAGARFGQAIDLSIEPSYVGLGSGLRLGGDRSPDNLIYEAQIVKNIEWLRAKGQGDWLWRVDLPIRFVVRQQHADSNPVRTPTYNPGVRAYLGKRATLADAAESADVFSAGLFHYSNGQDGKSLNEDGTVNTLNGSFSTNYAEFAWLHVLPRSDAGLLRQYRLSLRQDFYGSWDAAQVGQYPRRQLKAESTLRFGDSAELRLALGYRMGYDYRVLNTVQPVLDESLRLRDRFQVDVQLLPSFFKFREVDGYIRYQWGYDDYNIQFQQRMSRLMIGLSSPF